MSESNLINSGTHAGDVAGRDIIHINVIANETNKDSIELLVSSQRIELNNSVQTIANMYFKLIEDIKEEHGKNRTEDERKNAFASKLWKQIHAHLGVDSVKQIKLKQFQEAKHFIELLATEYDNKATDKQLVAEIMTKINNHKIFNESVDWCFCNFGKKRFNELNHDQLLQVIAYVNQYIKELKKPKGLLAFIKMIFS